jgi:hypothetical protein
MVLAIHKTGEVDGQLIVLKHRAGATGYVDVKWDGKATRYSDPTELDTSEFDSGRKDPEWVSGWNS